MTYAFSPRTRSWTRRAGQLRTGRGDFTGSALNGLVYVYGGYSVPTGFCLPLSSAEAYSPANDSWVPAPPLPINIAEKGVGLTLGGYSEWGRARPGGRRILREGRGLGRE